MRIGLLLFLAICIPLGLMGQTAQSTLVYMGPNGKLVYKADARGNIIPDFSYVGYKHSEEAIPFLPVVKTIVAYTGDNLAKIQNAINEVGAMTPDANGIRGAILLKAGVYKVSNSINLNKSGVVLRGEGNSTRILATRRAQHNVINLKGSGGPSYNSATRKKITDSYVAIGARTVTVEAGHTFQVGDRIILERKPNQAWISLLGMDRLRSDKTQWTPEAYTFLFKRVVVAVNGNSITIDAPVVDPIDPKYAEGFLYECTWTKKIENSGVENMILDSEYSSAEDEQHAWNGVQIDNAENCWVQNVEGHHFGYATTDMDGHAYKISVINCKFLDPISTADGGRRYSFNIGGQQCLVKDCYTKSGRHDYVLDARTPGPNVFLNCKADNQKDDSGPHQRWAVGCLFDNVSGNKELNVMNRSNSGSGHGWAGAQMLFWNCKFAKHTLQDPPADHINWAIGCTAATITGVGRYETEPIGFVESKGTNVTPQSLFDQQLKDRLSKAPENIAPTVTIVTPVNNATFTNGTTVYVNANASDFDGSITKIDLFYGSILVATEKIAPYEWNIAGLAAGTYVLKAIATDNAGAQTTSSLITFTVQAANVLPTVTITSPVNAATYVAPASITISADAADSDGTISKVDFYNGSTLLGSDNSAPYTVTWSNVAAGTYTITSKAIDNTGAITTSTSVNVTVNNNTANACSALPKYVENNGYVGGSKVQNAGGIYQCKPYPYTGWCNGAAWAYAPGTGTYWTDAWNKVGACSAKSAMNINSTSDKIVEVFPNPTTTSSVIRLNVQDLTSVDYMIVDPMGVVVSKGQLDNNSEGRIDMKGMNNGIYTIKLFAGENVWYEKLVKQ